MKSHDEQCRINPFLAPHFASTIEPFCNFVKDSLSVQKGWNEAKPRTIIERALALFNLSKELEDVIVKSKILPSKQVDEFLESDSTVRVIKEHFKIPVGGDFPSPCSRAIIVGLSTIKENARPVIKGTEKRVFLCPKIRQEKRLFQKHPI